MISVAFDKRKMDELKAALGGLEKGISKELGTAVNATAKKMRFEIGKEVRKELAAPAKVVKDAIFQKTKATKENPEARLVINKTRRLPLRDFRPTQIKRGVTYKTSPKVGRSVARGAFIVEAYGGHVYKRRTPERGPLVKLYGASPWGAFVKRNLAEPMAALAKIELAKQIDRRIRYLQMKAANKLNWQQKGR